MNFSLAQLSFFSHQRRVSCEMEFMCPTREIYSPAPPEATCDDIIEFDMEHKIGKSDEIKAMFCDEGAQAMMAKGGGKTKQR